MLMPAALPDSIGQLQALWQLDLRDNTIAGAYLRSTNCALTALPAAVPESIGQLQALKGLSLRGNKIAGTCFCSTSNTLIHACSPA